MGDAAGGFHGDEGRRSTWNGPGIVLAQTIGMPSILIADDCAPVASIMARHLRDAGHRVFLAKDGAEALALLGRLPIDCILLDLLMPTMTGIQLLPLLKQDPATSAIPIVLVSARVGAGRSHIFAERDADICVGKPFTRQQILDAVEYALRPRHVAGAASATRAS